MTAPIVDKIKAFKAQQLDLDHLMTALMAHTWWVPINDDEAYAEYDDQDIGYLTVYSGPGMAAAHERWEQWDKTRLLRELEEDPEIGVVFDYSYEWATNLLPSQTSILKQY